MYNCPRCEAIKKTYEEFNLNRDGLLEIFKNLPKCTEEYHVVMRLHERETKEYDVAAEDSGARVSALKIDSAWYLVFHPQITEAELNAFWGTFDAHKRYYRVNLAKRSRNFFFGQY